jgi:hypothetical protein
MGGFGAAIFSLFVWIVLEIFKGLKIVINFLYDCLKEICKN